MELIRLLRRTPEGESHEWRPGEALPIWLNSSTREDLSFWLSHEPSETLSLCFFRSDESQCLAKINRGSGGERVGQFGYWSGRGDSLTAMQTWMANQGMRKIVGPIDFSTFGRYRLRLNQFDRTPLLNDPCNGGEQVKALSRAGFELEHKYVTYDFDDLEIVRRWAVQNKIGELSSHSLLPLNEFSEDRWTERLGELHELTLRAFADNPGFLPIQFKTFAALYGAQILRSVCLETSALAVNEHGKITGFCLNFRDASDPSRLLVKSIAVHPEDRAQGLSFLNFIQHILKAGRAYRKATICQMRMGNVPSLILRGLATETREYGLFSKCF